MGFIHQVVALLGLTIDNQKVQAFLANYPTLKIDKPSSGSQYVIGKAYGFYLLFDGGRMPKDRPLTTLFLYADNIHKHSEFTGELPLGFKFMQTHKALAAIKQPDTTWVIGEGRMTSNHPAPDSATWITPEFNLLASYLNDSIKAHIFQIQPYKPLDIENEWKPAPTWQKMALEKNMVEAIKLYRSEHNVGMAEAKKAIEEYVSAI